MSQSEPCLKQSYNARSQKWVLIDCNKKAGIQDMSPDKFPGVPVIKGPATDEHTNTKAKSKANNETKQQQSTEPPGPSGPDNKPDRTDSDWIF